MNFWSKRELATIFFRRATAEIPDGKKKNCLPVGLNGFQNTRLTTGLKTLFNIVEERFKKLSNFDVSAV